MVVLSRNTHKLWKSAALLPSLTLNTLLHPYLSSLYTTTWVLITLVGFRALHDRGRRSYIEQQVYIETLSFSPGIQYLDNCQNTEPNSLYSRHCPKSQISKVTNFWSLRPTILFTWHLLSVDLGRVTYSVYVYLYVSIYRLYTSPAPWAKML